MSQLTTINIGDCHATIHPNIGAIASTTNTLVPLIKAKSMSVEGTKGRRVTFASDTQTTPPQVEGDTNNKPTSNNTGGRITSPTKFLTEKDMSINTIPHNIQHNGESNTHAHLEPPTSPHTSPPPKSDLIKAIEKIITHESYFVDGEGLLHNDIALLQLQAPITSKHAGPVCLPNPGRMSSCY